MGWHNYQNAWVHVDNDWDLSDPEVFQELKRARNEVDQLLARQVLTSDIGQEFPDLTLRTPEEIWQEYLRGVPGSEVYHLDRPGRYEIKVMEGMPVIYMARRGQIVRKPREHIIDNYLPLRQPVPCYDLHDNDVFQGFLVCGLNGNRWSNPHAWQLEDPELPYSEEEVELSFPGPLIKGTLHGPGEGMLTEFLNLDVISEKDGRMDDQNRTEDELTYFDTESRWIDVLHNYEQPDYPEPKLMDWPGVWEASGMGEPDYGLTGCADCGDQEGDGGALDVNYWSNCDPVTGDAFYRNPTNYCACLNQCWIPDTSCISVYTHVGNRPWPGHAPAWMHPDYALFRYREIQKGHAEAECFDMCIMMCNSWWVVEDKHGGCGAEDTPDFCQCLIEKTRYLEKYIYSDILVDGEVVWSTHAYNYRWQKWQQEGCYECGCAIMWENQTQEGQTLILEDYAIVAPGFEDRGYKSGEYWMGLVQELKYANTYQFQMSPPYSGPPVTTCTCDHVADPVSEEYPYRWSIVFDDGTKWVVHDPGNDLDAVWTDTFRIYDFHGKPVYIGGIFISQDFGGLPSKRVYFMYYDGTFYLEEGVEPDHNCAWFGCYEHDVYGTAEGLELALNWEDEPAQGYGNGKCRAVGKYDTFWTQHTVHAGEEVTEEV